jgi:hypothetical protein
LEGGVDRRRAVMVMVYLEIGKEKAANLCLQGKPRGAGQDRGSDLPNPSSQPPVICAKKKAGLSLPKT